MPRKGDVVQAVETSAREYSRVLEFERRLAGIAQSHARLAELARNTGAQLAGNADHATDTAAEARRAHAQLADLPLVLELRHIAHLEPGTRARRTSAAAPRTAGRARSRAAACCRPAHPRSTRHRCCRARCSSRRMAALKVELPVKSSCEPQAEAQVGRSPGIGPHGKREIRSAGPHRRATRARSRKSSRFQQTLSVVPVESRLELRRIQRRARHVAEQGFDGCRILGEVGIHPHDARSSSGNAFTADRSPTYRSYCVLGERQKRLQPVAHLAAAARACGHVRAKPREIVGGQILQRRTDQHVALLSVARSSLSRRIRMVSIWLADDW